MAGSVDLGESLGPTGGVDHAILCLLPDSDEVPVCLLFAPVHADDVVVMGGFHSAEGVPESVVLHGNLSSQCGEGDDLDAIEIGVLGHDLL